MAYDMNDFSLDSEMSVHSPNSDRIQNSSRRFKV